MKKKVTFIFAAAAAAWLLTGCGGMSASVRQFDVGTIDGDTYTNVFADLTFTLPEGWVFVTGDEFDQFFEYADDEAFGEERSDFEEYEVEATEYCMYARAEDQSSGAMVMFDRLSGDIDRTDITEDEYMDLTWQQLSDNDDMEFEFVNRTDAVLGAYNFKALAALTPDIEMAQGFYIRRVGDYMLNVYIYICDEQSIDTIETYFG
jgi:hypothetical protein